MTRARLVLAVAPLLLWSCTRITFRLEERLDLQQVQSLEVEEVDIGRVLERLGPPLAIGAHDDGVAFLYERLELVESQLGLSIGDLFGPLLTLGAFGDLIKFSYGSSDSERTAVLLVFDADGVLQGRATSEWDENYGRSGGLQVIVNVEGVVDSGSLRLPPRPLTWGVELLQRVPMVLNLQHGADAELVGSRGYVGQRALEW